MSIRGINGHHFGNLICSELGFGENAAQFIGTRQGYNEYMSLSQMSNDGESCVPDFIFEGARCSETIECKEKNCTKKINCRITDTQHNAHCIKGQSDVFVHCRSPKTENTGEWTDWEETDTCGPNNYFRQRVRSCQASDCQKKLGPVFCSGPWLEVSRYYKFGIYLNTFY